MFVVRRKKQKNTPCLKPLLNVLSIIVYVIVSSLSMLLCHHCLCYCVIIVYVIVSSLSMLLCLFLVYLKIKCLANKSDLIILLHCAMNLCFYNMKFVIFMYEISLVHNWKFLTDLYIT